MTDVSTSALKPATSVADAVSVSPIVNYQGGEIPLGSKVASRVGVTSVETSNMVSGVFALSGTASSSFGVSSGEISAMVDGARQDLGSAAVNPDGTWSFKDAVGTRQASMRGDRDGRRGRDGHEP